MYLKSSFHFHYWLTKIGKHDNFKIYIDLFNKLKNIFKKL